MRGIAIAVLSLAMVSGAQASSILVLDGRPAGNPSIVTPSETQAGTSSVVTAGAAGPGMTAGPSIVVLGEPAVSGDKVAAIPEASRRNARPGGVLVIRAGVAGSASAAPAAAPAVAAANGDGKAPTLRDAMTEAGQAPAMPQ